MKSLLFTMVFISVLFYSCDRQGNEAIQINDSDSPITNRTSSPGSYSVNSNGILEFPTDSDFHQTVSYIFTDSTGGHLYSFHSSFSMKTINKQADIIIDSVENILNYPSKIPSKWSNYDHFVNFVIQSGDTAVTHKYGAWGEFLNLQNLVVIEGSLYKITNEKTIIITDGDIGKLDDAEELEESDTTNGIYVTPSLTPRAC
jgi:hypothetical protein